MANGVWHTRYGIEINLSLPDLGHPGRPDLLGEITASVADREPQLLECLAHHDGRDCLPESGGKSPWMFIRRGRVGGRRPLVASHLPVTHKATPAESEQHKATKERIVETASRYGLDADAEVPTANRRSISDALVTGPGGIRIGWEIQYHHLSPSSVHRRSVSAVQQDITPLWVAKDRTASLIDRAPWARVDDMAWKDIAGGKEMVIRGGYRHLQVWKCVASSDRHCLVIDGAGHCGAVHSDWFLPALCLPEKKAVHLEDLVLSSATGESVPVYVPNRGSGRADGTCGFPRPTASAGGRWSVRRLLSLWHRGRRRAMRSPSPSRRSTETAGRVRRAGSSATHGLSETWASRPADSPCRACRRNGQATPR
ncbi:hypothetical protein ABZ384_29295 [Streptomyces cyaneofuscatus]|uniref:competence protein CoiA family protein n=1 Tax=Streptomyces cyaneofuscatus TaxID=66883 RepID=UPI0033CC70EF